MLIWSCDGPRGEFRDQLRSVDDVLRFFPGAVFIDQWKYATDGKNGLGGSLLPIFGTDGRIDEVTYSYID